MTPSAGPPRAARTRRRRHLPIVGALVVVAAVLLVARDPGAVARLFADGRALREGTAEARALQTPEALLDWILAHPEHASLVVVDADGAVRLDAAGDVHRPLAGLPTLLLAAEWADQATSGRLDTAAVAPARLAERLLPGLGAPSDTARVGTARVGTSGGGGGPLTPDVLVRRALAGDRAAESVLGERLGPGAVAARAARHGVDPPVPFEGHVLAWTAGAPSREAAAALARRFAEDAAFRDAARRRLGTDGVRLPLAEQRAAAAATLPQGTAAAYARLLADALEGSLAGSAASARLLDVLAVPDRVGGAVRFGAKGGGFPGHLALGAFAQAPGGEGQVAVLVLEDLPLALFYHLARTGLEGGLLFRLLTDDTFLSRTARAHGQRLARRDRDAFLTPL